MNQVLTLFAYGQTKYTYFDANTTLYSEGDNCDTTVNVF